MAEFQSDGRGQTFSVAITTYHQAPFIGAAIESVLAQTRVPDEIVVIDDGSRDGTARVVDRFGARVRLRRSRNRGVAGARNLAMSETRGDLVALLDGDDLMCPTKIERCLMAVRDVPDVQVIVHDIETVSADARRVLDRGPVARVISRRGRDLPSQPVDCWRALVEDHFIWTSSQVVIRRNLYFEIGQSNPRFRVGDYDLYLRLAERVRFVLVPEVLIQWRQHDASASGSGRGRQMTWAVDRARVLGAQARHPVASRRASAGRPERRTGCYCPRDPAPGRVRVVAHGPRVLPCRSPVPVGACRAGGIGDAGACAYAAARC